MQMTVESYLRRGRRKLARLMLDPKLRTGGTVLLYGGGAFLLTAASIANYPQPIAMGLLCGASGWQAAVMALGAALGYPFFWGHGGTQGMVWVLTGGALSLLLHCREEAKEQPLMIPSLTAFLTALTALVFRLFLGDKTPLLQLGLRVAVSFFSGVLFLQASRVRDTIVEWLIGGVGVLALAQIELAGWLNLGAVAAGFLGVYGAFPAAALAGLGMDLAQVTALPVTGVMCMAFFIRMIPFDKRWQHFAAPGFAGVITMAVCGVWEWEPLPGLFLGGFLAWLMPPRPGVSRRRGESGAAQVRLELGAELMTTMGSLIRETALPPIDTQAILEKARYRACDSCSARKSCLEQAKLTVQHLQYPMDVDCRKQGRLVPELRRGQEQLRYLKADRQRQEEYRAALEQQYRFLSAYLRGMADALPRKAENILPCFTAEVAARSKGKESVNGDRALAFPGVGNRYFLLLCDGMGTGLGAAREGQWAASLLRQLLVAGFPPEHALESVNSLMALRGSAGAVTMDLAEVQLDTGLCRVFKWGAAPSLLLRRCGTEKIGTATPPPGICVGNARAEVSKLSLRRGEVLILISDGVDGEGVLRRLSLTPDVPPGELAAEILEKGCGGAEDDATAAVIRLRPTGMATS